MWRERFCVLVAELLYSEHPFGAKKSMARTLFIEGPAGVGKTEYALKHVRTQLDTGAQSNQLLVLVPYRALGYPYYAAFSGAEWPSGVQIDVVTFGGLVRRALDTFWPVVTEKEPTFDPQTEPAFLTIETSQYFMARFVNEAVKQGVFDGVSITPHNIMRQTLDNLSKTAVNTIPVSEIAARLTAAWGPLRHTSRQTVYVAAQTVAEQFRAHCLQNSLLDFSLQIKLFMDHLLSDSLYAERFRHQYRHLIVDNLEENPPVVADFIRWMWNGLESALLLYDWDGGYRTFLGAAPDEMHKLVDLCQETQVWDTPVHTPPVMVALTGELGAQINRRYPSPGSTRDDTGNGDQANPRAGFTYTSHKFYPQMIDWVVETIVALVESGTSPNEIVVLAPFLGDSLRFALTTRLTTHGIKTVSHRPSRAIRDEPAARAMLTFLALVQGDKPPVADVTDALQQAVDELDPVRAWLLTRIVYRPSHDGLGTFEDIHPATQERITFRAGNKYDVLRRWLHEHGAAEPCPPDHFFSRLFGEVLSQPGYGFHTNYDAGRVIAELVESARKFRQVLYPKGADNWNDVAREYLTLLQEGLLAALHVPSWHAEEQDAVFIAPAHTFLMRNRWVDIQFWLDVGSNQWWERLEQPLTHPYVLARSYPKDQVWTDKMEFESRQEALRRLMVGLVRRCR
ncbi:MAG: hypothetical protein JXQ72_04395, partial [Anaerolineae bacterium]|nr:hypothetical protein [Anaerolineae bacterium]